MAFINNQPMDEAAAYGGAAGQALGQAFTQAPLQRAELMMRLKQMQMQQQNMQMMQQYRQQLAGLRADQISGQNAWHQSEAQVAQQRAAGEDARMLAPTVTGGYLRQGVHTPLGMENPGDYGPSRQQLGADPATGPVQWSMTPVEKPMAPKFGPGGAVLWPPGQGPQGVQQGLGAAPTADPGPAASNTGWTVQPGTVNGGPKPMTMDEMARLYSSSLGQFMGASRDPNLSTNANIAPFMTGISNLVQTLGPRVLSAIKGQQTNGVPMGLGGATNAPAMRPQQNPNDPLGLFGQ